jgi:hypothetical protein
MADLLCWTLFNTKQLKQNQFAGTPHTKFSGVKCPYDSKFRNDTTEAVTSISAVTSSSLLCSAFLEKRLF